MTKDAVAGVVQMLRARGEVPSQRKVLTLLGSGSKRDVARYLHELAGATTDAVPGAPVYDPDVAAKEDPDGAPGEAGTTRDDMVPVQDAIGDESGEPDPAQSAQTRLARAEQDLATAQETLHNAIRELEEAAVQEALAREEYHTHEAVRLRTGTGGTGGDRDTLRHVWAAARCAKETLADVLETLQSDVARAQETVHEADAAVRQAVARQGWNSMVPQQHQAMARLEQAVVQAKAAVDEIVTLAAAQAPHGLVLGLTADAYLFRRRALRFWLDYRLAELTGHRPDPAIYHWMEDETLQGLNPFAHRAPVPQACASGARDDDDDEDVFELDPDPDVS